MYYRPVIFSISISMLLVIVAPVMANQLSLLQAMDLTLRNNADLASKQAVFEAGKEVVEQAKANIRPAIDLRHTMGNSVYSTAYFQDLDDRYTRTSLAIVQPLYSAQRLINLSRSESIVQVSETEFELTRQSKMLELIEAYITLLKFEATKAIAEQEVDDHLIKMQRLEKMLQRGLATKMDSLEARSVLDELNSNLVTIQNDTQVSRTRLSRLLGTTFNGVEPIDMQLWQRSRTLIEQKDWHTVAINNALEVELAKQQYEVAKYDLDIEKAVHLPSVNFRLELSRNETYDSSILKDKKVQLEMTIPIYHGGMINSKSRAAQKQLKSKLYQLHDREQLVQIQLEEVLTKLDGGTAKIEALQKSIDSNQAYLEAAQKGLTYGLRGLYDVLEAKSRLYATQRKLMVEQYNNIFSQFEFLYLMGRLDRSMVKHYLSPDFSFRALNLESQS